MFALYTKYASTKWKRIDTFLLWEKCKKKTNFQKFKKKFILVDQNILKKRQYVFLKMRTEYMNMKISMKFLMSVQH